MPSSVEKQILEELRMLRERVERLEALLEEKLIGVEEPEPDEVEAIEEYADAKKKGKVSFIKLEDLET
ncbi:MAG TPA: hypothetical protein ENF87_02510 [Thermoproteales archaeon]|nr:hypothetical protein [Thermoproteales archaeon]